MFNSSSQFIALFSFLGLIGALLWYKKSNYIEPREAASDELQDKKIHKQKQNVGANASQSTKETSNRVSESLIEAIAESLIQDGAPLETKESSSYNLNIVVPTEDLQAKDSEQFVSSASIQLTRMENIIEESSETVVPTQQDTVAAELVADPLEEFAYSKLVRTDSNLSSVSAKSNDTLKNKNANSLLGIFMFEIWH